MLVKFISFVITVFGTKRYQPIVFASIALVISAVGVTTVLTTYEAPSGAAASTADHAEDATTDTIPAQTPAKKSLREDTTNTQQSDQGTPATSETPATTGTPATTAKDAATAPTIQLSTTSANLTLKAGEASNAITASISDNVAVQWAISSEPASGLTIETTAPDKLSSTSKTSFTIKAATAGSYTLTVHAKDGARGVDVTKIITLTITAN